jgi:hypothetical protein
MTRDDAINKLWGAKGTNGMSLTPAMGHHQAMLLVEQLMALGLLKLDEPKTAEDKLWDELASVSRFDRSDSMLKRAIDRAGLKIVEK